MKSKGMKIKNQILVKQILELMEESTPVAVILYAYGVYYGDTNNDGMETVKDCKEQMNYDCINAMVTRIYLESVGKQKQKQKIVICAEIVH